MDPLDFRLKNAAKEGTKAAHGPIFPRIGYIETVEAAKSVATLQGAARQAAGQGRRVRLLVQRRRRILRASQHHRGRQRRRHHRPSRYRRLARRHRQHLRRAARHRLPPRLRHHRRHPDDRLLQPHRRQPRAVRLRDGGDAVDRKDHPDAARARRKDLGDRSRSGEVGERRGASGQPQCRPVRAADAGRACREGTRDGRSDRRRRAAQHRKAPTAASARISATSRSMSSSASRA